MTTGYRGGATTPDLDYRALERRVDDLEKQLERHERQSAERWQFVGYIAYSMMLAVLIAAVVYLAALPD